MMCGAEILILPEGVQRVSAMLRASGHPHAPVMLNDAARTAQQAADALGVSVGQIAKSIVFRRKQDDAAVLVVTSGDQRVDEKKVEALVCAGKRLARADAVFVKAKTGFSIGGVAPLAHTTLVLVLIDRSLFRFDELWAAAGHPHAVFQLSPVELERLTQAVVADLAVEQDAEKTTLRHAIALVTLRAQMLEEGADVPSPCISICRMNAATTLCEGCFRTRDEIATWGGADDAGKRAVWRTIVERMEIFQGR